MASNHLMDIILKDFIQLVSIYVNCFFYKKNSGILLNIL